MVAVDDTEGMDEHTTELTVGAAAQLLDVSVRTLHHWDAIGLASPSERTWAGYRIYTAADMQRLRRVLIFRELGLPLSEIGRILDDPDIDLATELAEQRASLLTRIDQLQRVVSAVERMMETTTMGKKLTAAEQAEILGPNWNPDWEAEAQQRWGQTDEWAQSEAIKQKMTAADWQRVKDDTEAFEAELAAAFTRGVEPGSREANTLAERHRASIGQWYDMTIEKQVCISRLYLSDPRFAAHYDERADGLAAWLVDVIAAGARARGVDPETAESQ